MPTTPPVRNHTSRGTRKDLASPVRIPVTVSMLVGVMLLCILPRVWGLPLHLIERRGSSASDKNNLTPEKVQQNLENFQTEAREELARKAKILQDNTAALGDHTGKISANTAKLGKVQDDVKDQQTSLTNLERNTAAMKGQVKSVDGKIDEEVKKVDGKIDEVGNEVKSVDGKIDEVGNEVKKVDGKIDDEVKKVDERIDQKVAEVGVEVKKVDGKIDEEVKKVDEKIGQKVAKVGVEVKKVDGKIDEVGNEVKSMYGKIDEVNNEVKDVGEKMNKKVDRMNNSITEVTNNMEKMDADANVHLSKLDTALEKAAEIDTTLKSSVDELNLNSNQVQKDLQHLSTKTTQFELNTNNEFTKLKGEATGVKNDLLLVKQKEDELEKKITATGNDLMRNDEALKTTLHAKLNDQSEQTNAKLHDLQTATEKLQSETSLNSESIQSTSVLTNKIEAQLHENTQTFNDAIAETKNMLSDEQDKMKESLVAQMNTAEDELHKTASSIQNVKKDLKKELQETETELKDLQKKFKDDLSSQVSAKVSAAEAKLKANGESLEQKLIAAEREFSAQLNNLTAHKDKGNEARENLEEGIRAMEKSFDQNWKKIEILVDDNNRALKQVEKEEANIKQDIKSKYDLIVEVGIGVSIVLVILIVLFKGK